MEANSSSGKHNGYKLTSPHRSKKPARLVFGEQDTAYNQEDFKMLVQGPKE